MGQPKDKMNTLVHNPSSDLQFILQHGLQFNEAVAHITKGRWVEGVVELAVMIVEC